MTIPALSGRTTIVAAERERDDASHWDTKEHALSTPSQLFQMDSDAPSADVSGHF
jgi:hypothetical protein